VNRNLTVTVFLCAAIFVAISGFSQTKSPLQGVWKPTEIVRTGPNASTNKNPQPCLIIFTGKYYSIVCVTSDKPRPDLPQDINTATVAQLGDGWGPFTGQSGAYDVKGSEVTYRRSVAKSPIIMAPGSFAIDTFKTEGYTLTLVDKATRNGPVANPGTVKLIRVE